MTLGRLFYYLDSQIKLIKRAARDKTRLRINTQSEYLDFDEDRQWFGQHAKSDGNLVLINSVSAVPVQSFFELVDQEGHIALAVSH